jgi:hypothetical protein
MLLHKSLIIVAIFFEFNFIPLFFHQVNNKLRKFSSLNLELLRINEFEDDSNYSNVNKAKSCSLSHLTDNKYNLTNNSNIENYNKSSIINDYFDDNAFLDDDDLRLIKKLKTKRRLLYHQQQQQQQQENDSINLTVIMNNKNFTSLSEQDLTADELIKQNNQAIHELFIEFEMMHRRHRSSRSNSRFNETSSTNKLNNIKASSRIDGIKILSTPPSPLFIKRFQEKEGSFCSCCSCSCRSSCSSSLSRSSFRNRCRPYHLMCQSWCCSLESLDWDLGSTPALLLPSKLSKLSSHKLIT